MHCPPPHNPPHPCPVSGKNLFLTLVLQFCWRENIGSNKIDIEFLLVWDKDNYTEIPSVGSTYLCIATHIGSSFPDLFTTSWSLSYSGLCQFKITLFLLYNEHINPFKF
jgi:hypothetical protein